MIFRGSEFYESYLRIGWLFVRKVLEESFIFCLKRILLKVFFMKINSWLNYWVVMFIGDILKDRKWVKVIVMYRYIRKYIFV